MSRPVIAVVFLGASLAPRPALADEDDRSLSVDLAATTFRAGDELYPYGGWLGLEYERGLSESYGLRVAAGGGLLYEDGTEDLPSGMVWRGQAVGGLVYLFDVLKYVPYATVGLGVVARGGGPLDTDVYPMLELGGGIDRLRSRTFSWGGFVRVSAYLDDDASLTLGLRTTWRWGLF